MTTVTRFGGDARPAAAGPEFHLEGALSWRWTLAVSPRSMFLSLKHEIAHMIGHGGGAIVNVTSLSALHYVPAAGAAYAAAKAGLIQLTKIATVTYAGRGVRVNCITLASRRPPPTTRPARRRPRR